MAISIKVPGRFSYLCLWKPRAQGDKAPRYSVSVLIPKSDTKTVAMIRKADAECKEAYSEKIGKVKAPTCLKDGDVPDKNGNDRPAEYKNHWYINASADEDSQPDAVDAQCHPIIKQTDIKSGDYGFVAINLFGYDVDGSKGIGAGFQSIMKVKDGPSLGGAKESAEDAFANVNTSYFGDIDTPAATGDCADDGDDW